MRHTIILRFVVICAMASQTLGRASASEKARIKSRFTTIELKTCESAKINPDGGAWICKGLSGYPVYVADGRNGGDLRQFVSFGPVGQTRRAATQSTTAFSSIFALKRNRATIEWRFRRVDGRDVPYATIVRFYTTSSAAKGKAADSDGNRGDGNRGEVLIVTKVTPTEACQLALIDARANADAIMLARSAADELTAAFDCKSDQPRIVGATGRSPM
jgi:hypothetical protein